MNVRHTFIAIMTLLALGSPALAVNVPLNISATVLSKNVCRFSVKTAALNFGNLDPTTPVNVSGTALLSVRCQGSANPATFLISDDDGLNETGLNGNRMQHAVLAGNYIPYSLSYTPTTATVPKNLDIAINITGSINGADYATAPAGLYNDTVTLTVVP